MAKRHGPGAGKKQAPPGRVRIVAGKWRGRLLPVCDAPGLRPTSERIRETLFNWLAPIIEGASCLDLFAGTGVLGFEARSRGAADVILVEKSGAVAKSLRHSIDTLDDAGVTLRVADAFDFLERETASPRNVVFLDPPYALKSLPDLCRLLHNKSWLAADARVYLEQDRGENLPELPDGWRVLREKTAGNVRYLLASVSIK